MIKNKYGCQCIENMYITAELTKPTGLFVLCNYLLTSFCLVSALFLTFIRSATSCTTLAVSGHLDGSSIVL